MCLTRIPTGRPGRREYFVGVPAPAGAVLVLLPAYMGFIGVEPDRPLVFRRRGFTVLIAFLLVSRLPVYSGKTIGKHAGATASCRSSLAWCSMCCCW